LDVARLPTNQMVAITPENLLSGDDDEEIRRYRDERR
jgi:hypothetical protein